MKAQFSAEGSWHDDLFVAVVAKADTRRGKFLTVVALKDNAPIHEFALDLSAAEVHALVEALEREDAKTLDVTGA